MGNRDHSLNQVSRSAFQGKTIKYLTAIRTHPGTMNYSTKLTIKKKIMRSVLHKHIQHVVFVAEYAQ